MHIKPGTLCILISAGAVPELAGRQCTLVTYDIPPLYRSVGADCLIEIPSAPSLRPTGLWAVNSRRLRPLDGWDAENELALDVQNELALQS